MIQDAHGGEALLLPHLPPPQRQDEQPQRAHQEEPRGVLAGKMSFIIIIHYYHSLLSRGVLAGKMSFIIIIYYYHGVSRQARCHSLLTVNMLFIEKQNSSTILIFNYLSYTGSYYTS